MLTAPAARRLAQVLRGSLPLADVLALGAGELLDILGASGATLVVQRDGRAIRGQAGTLDERAREIALGEGDVDATLLIPSDTTVPDDLLLIVTLALEARFLAESAQTDGLTGVANRRTFDARLREEWQRAAREHTSLVVAILDIDYFKVYNDRHGHLAGDDVLCRVAHAASATLQRAGDRFARYGGEEFALILPTSSLAGGIAAAERIRAAVAALSIPHPVGKAGRLTVSVGVAASEPAATRSADDLLAAADRELYRAKAEGRDRVAADGYEPEHEEPDALPKPFSALIGRERDVRAVNRAIDVCRVVTVVGAAGVGKTRLALAAAQDAAKRFVHVRFVDALGATNDDEIMGRVRAALGVSDADDVERALRAGGDSTLLVLDGCERIADACRNVVEVLAKAPLHVLATSRVPLGARDERIVRLQPLDADATRALLIDRAQAAGIVADPDDPDVAALLRRIAGSPVATELAAAQLAGTTPQALLRAFDGAAAREGADRATLGSLLVSAVGALDADEAAALIALTAFRGTFSASDAAAVIPSDEIDARLADALLRAIAGRSLLDAASHDGITRWRMIDPVRAAASAVASAAPVQAAAFAAHVRWCLNRLDTIAERSGTGKIRAALIESESVIDEVRVALDRALARPDLLETGAELCIAAVRQWFAVRHPREGRARAEAYLDRADQLPAMLSARLHAAAARLAFIDGDLGGTEAHARAADALLGDRDLIERSPVLNFLGIAAKFRGEYVEAERLFRVGREMNTRIGNTRGEAIAIGALGTIAFDFRLDYDDAVRQFREAAAIFRRIGDDLSALVMTGNLAESLAARGDYSDAAETVAGAVDEVRSFGNPGTTGHLLCVSGLIHALRGDLESAARAMREVFPIIEDGTPGTLTVMTLIFCAQIAAHAGDDAFAAALIGAAERQATADGTPLLPIQRFWRDPITQGLRNRLGALYAQSEARGRTANVGATLAALDEFLAGLIATT